MGVTVKTAVEFTFKEINSMGVVVFKICTVCVEDNQISSMLVARTPHHQALPSH